MSNNKIKEPYQDECLFCKKLVDKNFEMHPFCSIRCKKADFNQWLSGDYSVVDTETIVSIPSSDDDKDE